MSTPRLLGFAGILPFYLSLAAVLMWPQSQLALVSLIGYGAVILSFLGAVHWGMAMQEPDQTQAGRSYVFSVVPALLGWLAFISPYQPALIVLAAGFGWVWLREYQKPPSLMPAWYRQLRGVLTAAILPALIIGAIFSG
ncbi:MAG: DUF3429 domain-containing protein [Alkalimonas sp.]|uniref:DUF3429 domain-containing protein n=1 Tax=Alkalimonas delamerensis TaxID=265981 RepID=A0ABT9GSG4_9GAMM|nr:DUF3429 domain-containing protein [Alkalimonas delamerensis]MCC5852822.1 DUF3429 domain-containing protein [Alkalimonas sp.]MDP4529913.1 DUF3429 domain-containing protein [Alkalimonas delamerensis]